MSVLQFLTLAFLTIGIFSIFRAIRAFNRGWDSSMLNSKISRLNLVRFNVSVILTMFAVHIARHVYEFFSRISASAPVIH